MILTNKFYDDLYARGVRADSQRLREERTRELPFALRDVQSSVKELERVDCSNTLGQDPESNYETAVLNYIERLRILQTTVEKALDYEASLIERDEEDENWVGGPAGYKHHKDEVPLARLKQLELLSQLPVPIGSIERSIEEIK